MPLKIEEIPETELQQNLEQLNIVDNNSCECDVDGNLPTLANAKRWSDEITRSEDGSHEIGSNVANNNDKDVASSADESDFSLPKHRKDYPSDDERSDSEPLSNEEDDMDSEGSGYSPSPSAVYEQKTIEPSNTHLQVNGVNVPFEVSPMSLSDRPLQGDDIDVARIVNPIVGSIADLKSELLAKLNYCPDPNLDGMKIDENWKHTKFEKSQDQHCYDAIVTAGKFLDIIMPMQIPEEARERLAQARHILLEKSLLYRTTSTEDINLSSSSTSQAANNVDFIDSAPDNTAKSDTNDNESSKDNELSARAKSSSEYNNQISVETDTKFKDQKSTVVDDTTKNESSNDDNVAISHKYRRGSTQGRKLRRHLTRGASTYSSPKSGRRNHSYSPRTSNVRSPRVVNTVTSSVAGSATQANNRRFAGFLPSRCFTCGGIGHFASNCSNKGAYTTTSPSNNQQLSHSRRRSNTNNRFRRPVVNNPTSNE